MTFLQTGLAKAAAATGYQIARSLRFNSADSTTLSRTLSAGGSKTTWTYSVWIKRSSLYVSGDLGIFATMPSPQQNRLHFMNGDKLIFLAYNGGGFVFQVQTTQVFRDLSAWFHLVAVVDSTNATASDRIRLYVNGVRITAFDVATYPSQNADCLFNGATLHEIGGYGGGNYYNGYYAEPRFIDGQALDPTSFGQTDTATGVWVPKTYTGTYGTNGFWLKLDDNSNTTAATLGKDSSGNGNNWTPNNFSVTAGVGNDSLVDSPTNYGTDTGAGGEVRGNYCTLNPLDNGGTALVNGNLDTSNSGAGWKEARGTIFVSSGKWYWESTLTGSGDAMVGVATSAASNTHNFGAAQQSWTYFSTNGNKFGDASWSSGAAYGATYTNGDVIGIALNMDAGTITFYKNGASQGTAFTSLTGYTVAPYHGQNPTGITQSINFGQRPFANTAPSGFKALCSTNLATPAIGASSSTLASKNFNVVTYTGNDTNGRTITGVGFQPDLVWIKMRSGTAWHMVSDAVRGANINFFPNATDAELTNNANGYTSAFTSDGFTVTGGSTGDDNVNNNSSTYVAWNWNAGGSNATNTSGTITSTVRANTTAGISVVTYTGNGTGGATVGHGLGVAPKMIITKARVATGLNWAVYHASLGATKNLWLSLTDAVNTQTVIWNDTAPTSSVFTVGSAGNTNSTQGMVAYCFAEVAGFSKFGSYTGNGSADGPFVYCGFRPRYVMIKRTDSAVDWFVYDTARNTYNQVVSALYPNLSIAEVDVSGLSPSYVIDVLSNGFKLRGARDTGNASGGTYIFAAFAEAPFNYARAR